jgi:alpha-L-fucosidase 2
MAAIKEEHIVLNDITLWSGAPQDANNYEAYKSLPEIRGYWPKVKTTKPSNWLIKTLFAQAKDRAASLLGNTRCLAICISNSLTLMTVNIQITNASFRLDNAVATSTYQC